MGKTLIRALILVCVVNITTIALSARQSECDSCVDILLADRLSVETQASSKAIWRSILKTSELKPRFTTSANRRALRMVQEGEAEVYLYKAQVFNPNVFIGARALAQTYMVVVTRDKKVPLTGLNKSELTAAGMRGDGLHNVVRDVKQFLNMDSYKQALDMLRRGRIDYFLDYETEVTAQFSIVGAEPNELNIRRLKGPFPLFPVFHKSEKGDMLHQLYVKWVDQATASGELQTILDQNNRSEAFPAAFVSRK